MNLPALKILNQNFINDLTFLNQMFVNRNQGNIYDLLSKLKPENLLNKNFELVNEYVNSYQDKKKELTDNQKINIQGILLYTTSYISINNFLAKLLENKTNIKMSDIILNLVHARYTEYLPLFGKPEYNNPYSSIIVNLVNDALKCDDVQKLNNLEIEINNVVPNFVRKAIESKKITREDDFSFASFSIRTQAASKLFRALFETVRNKTQKDDKSPDKKNGEPTSNLAINPDEISFKTGQQKTGPILTKDIPTDGAPKDWKKDKKTKKPS